MAFDMFKRKTTSPPAGLGRGVDGSAGSATRTSTVSVDGTELDGKLVVQRRHVEWIENRNRWQWLMDSFEGGERYRNAVYGPDRRGLPCRNLFRHKREYPDPQLFPNNLGGFLGSGSSIGGESTMQQTGPQPGMLGADPAATAMDDDYELRRARTPIPEFVAEAIEIHIAKVFDGEIVRDGPDDLKEWWKNVDGRGCNIDEYMRQKIGPLLLMLGCIDICLDHPVLPVGAKPPTTRFEEIKAGLNKVVASYILPMNMVWWRTGPDGRYVECLVREYVNPSDRMDHDQKGNAIDPDSPDGPGQAWRRDYVRWRLWRSDESIVFNYDGSEVLGRTPHNFGRVPIVRVIDLIKHRTESVGKSRYESIAEYQREFYNRDSELILSDTLQAHPFLSGPEDYCKADNTLSVGPGYLLPKKKNPENGSYEGFEYVSPPKDPAESLRKNKDDILDLKDRRACLSQPAGSQSPGTVGQSGISKQLDAHTGHKLLSSIAQSLSRADSEIAQYATIVLRDGAPIAPAELEKIGVGYPMRFELNDAATLIDGTTKFQLILGAVGNAPQAEQALLSATIRQLLVGLKPDEYKSFDDEFSLLVATKATIKEREREGHVADIEDLIDATDGDGSTEQAAQNDPSGESAGTMVSGVTPADES